MSELFATYEKWKSEAKDYFKESRSIYSESCKNLINLSTFAIGFLIAITELFNLDISSIYFKLLLFLTILLFLASITFGILVLKDINTYMNKVGIFFDNKAELLNEFLAKKEDLVEMPIEVDSVESISNEHTPRFWSYQYISFMLGLVGVVAISFLLIF